jgi:hypothetical protein
MRWNENLAPEGTDAPMPAAAELCKHRVETLGWNRPHAVLRDFTGASMR